MQKAKDDNYAFLSILTSISRPLSRQPFMVRQARSAVSGLSKRTTPQPLDLPFSIFMSAYCTMPGRKMHIITINETRSVNAENGWVCYTWGKKKVSPHELKVSFNIFQVKSKGSCKKQTITLQMGQSFIYDIWNNIQQRPCGQEQISTFLLSNQILMCKHWNNSL